MSSMKGFHFHVEYWVPRNGPRGGLTVEATLDIEDVGGVTQTSLSERMSETVEHAMAIAVTGNTLNPHFISGSGATCTCGHFYADHAYGGVCGWDCPCQHFTLIGEGARPPHDPERNVTIPVFKGRIDG